MKISIRFLQDFCDCVSKLTKEGTAWLGVKDGRFLIQNISTISGSLVVNQTSQLYPEDYSFGVTVNLSKLISVCKKLDAEYLNDELNLDYDDNQMKLSQKGVSFTFPLTDGEVVDFNLDGAVFENSIAEMLVAANTIETSNRFPGILVDGSNGLGRIVKFNNYAIALVNCELSFKKRVAIPCSFLRVISNSPIKSSVFKENYFGFIFENGVGAYTVFVDDNLPQGYLQVLGLENTLKMVKDGIYNVHTFDYSELASSVELSLAVADSKQTFLAIDSINIENEVTSWQVSCKDSGYEGAVGLNSTSSYIDKSLGHLILRGSDLLDVLKLKEPNVVIYDNGESPIIISSAAQNKILVFGRAE